MDNIYIFGPSIKVANKLTNTFAPKACYDCESTIVTH